MLHLRKDHFGMKKEDMATTTRSRYTKKTEEPSEENRPYLGSTRGCWKPKEDSLSHKTRNREIDNSRVGRELKKKLERKKTSKALLGLSE